MLVDQPESLPVGNPGARYLPQIAHTCTRLAEMVEKAADNGRVPVVLGGDHSIAIGTVSGMSRHFRKAQLKLGLIWIDAHADMNTPATSPSGNVHGMPLACCIGLGPRELTHIGGSAPQVEPTSVALIGLRSVDDVERFNVRGAGVHPFTMRDIDERGLPAVIRRGDRGRHARAPPVSICRSIWTRSIRERLPAWARPCAAASLIARRTWRWNWSAIAAA